MSKIVQFSVFWLVNTFTELILSAEPNFRDHHFVTWAAQN